MIEPKYKIGDIVYFNCGHIIETRITKVILTRQYMQNDTCVQDNTSIRYNITSTGLNEQREENLFETKELCLQATKEKEEKRRSELLLGLYKQKDDVLKTLEWIDYRITHFEALHEYEILSVTKPIYNE